MPQIIPRGDGWDIARVQAIMFFPDDAKLREHFLAVVRAAASTRSHQDKVIRMSIGGPIQGNHDDDSARVETLDAETIRQVISAPSIDEFKLLEHKSQRGGGTAGGMLLSLYLMSRFSLEPSMNRAIFVAEDFAKGKHYSDGRQLEGSEPAIGGVAKVVEI